VRGAILAGLVLFPLAALVGVGLGARAGRWRRAGRFLVGYLVAILVGLGIYAAAQPFSSTVRAFLVIPLVIVSLPLLVGAVVVYLSVTAPLWAVAVAAVLALTALAAGSRAAAHRTRPPVLAGPG
jgi:hypothetical protein